LIEMSSRQDFQDFMMELISKFSRINYQVATTYKVRPKLISIFLSFIMKI